MLSLGGLLEQASLIPRAGAIDWSMCPALAHFLDATVGPGWVTLETGVGLSTLVILRKQPRQHTAIHPAADAFAAILEFAERHRVDIQSLRPILARSPEWLPGMDLADLDLVLVGADDLPAAVADWHYGAEKLKLGGLMALSNTHPAAAAMLADFMGADPGWEYLMRDDAGQFAVYRKRTHPPNAGPWASQLDCRDASPAVRDEPSPGNWRAEPIGPRLACVEVRSWGEYQHYRAAMAGERRRREAVELALIDFGTDRFQVDGYCALCQRAAHLDVRFTYSYQQTPEGQPIPNWREHLVCACGFSNRIRAAVQILREEIRPAPDARIYLTEQVTGLYQWLRARYPRLIGTEYLGEGVQRGVTRNGIRNEDLTALTFADGSFDLILSFDVMEHVPDIAAAFRECRRCLRPGGILLFGAPFRLESAETVERARRGPDGIVEHLVPPEYHWQPLTGDNAALCFRDFGWNVLDQLRDAGFVDPRVLLYWSLELGYLGGDQVLLLATRPVRGEDNR